MQRIVVGHRRCGTEPKRTYGWVLEHWLEQRLDVARPGPDGARPAKPIWHLLEDLILDRSQIVGPADRAFGT